MILMKHGVVGGCIRLKSVNTGLIVSQQLHYLYIGSSGVAY